MPADLIKGLKVENMSSIKQVYTDYKSMAYKIVLSNNGTEHEAESIFHDALIALIENIKQEKFRGDSNLSTYLMSIVKFKWLTELKKKGKNKISIEMHDKLYVNEVDDKEEMEEMEMKYSYLEKSIELLNQECRKLLVAYYYKKMKLKDIARSMDYTDSFVRVKKVRCMNSLRSIILKNKS